MRVLFLVPYPKEGASNRYRVEQYIPYLEENGIRCRVRPFMSEGFFKILYQKGHWLRKGGYFLVSCLRRAGDLYRARNVDLVFIHREACPIGPPFFEWCFWVMRKPVVFDFDDAVFLPNSNILTPALRFLKCPWKVEKILRMSRSVIVANGYLEAYARRFNTNVSVIPTVVDTAHLPVKQHNENGKPVVGWIGTSSTSVYLEGILPVLEKLAERHSFTLRVIGSQRPIQARGVEVQSRRWSFEEDEALCRTVDIGIYPLPDTPWARGKAAFKAIQYMAAGLPVVASPVGMTAEVIQDGVNGFLASTESEWLHKLSLLIEQPHLRKRLGEVGRKTVEGRYAYDVHKKRFLNVVREASSGRPHAD